MKYKCPHCQQQHDIDDKLERREVECDSCRGLFIAPLPAIAQGDIFSPNLNNAAFALPFATAICNKCGDEILDISLGCSACGKD